MVLGLSYGLSGLGHELLPGCFWVWVWMVWVLSYGLSGLGYGLLSRWFGV